MTKKYLDELVKKFTHHNVEKRVNSLIDNMVRWNEQRDEMIKEYGNIAADVNRLCRSFEKQCRKVRNDKHKFWSPTLKEKIYAVRYWKIKCNELTIGNNKSNQ